VIDDPSIAFRSGSPREKRNAERVRPSSVSAGACAGRQHRHGQRQLEQGTRRARLLEIVGPRREQASIRDAAPYIAHAAVVSNSLESRLGPTRTRAMTSERADADRPLARRAAPPVYAVPSIGGAHDYAFRPPLADQAVLVPRRLAPMQQHAFDVARTRGAGAACRYALAAGRNRVTNCATSFSRSPGNASTAPPLATSKARSRGPGDLHDALAAFCRSGKPEAKPIGYAFRKVQGRPVAGKVLRREKLDRTGIVRWLVQICE
jgi:hypothetical protein